MGCSEGDFALLLLTEEAAIPKKNRRANKQIRTQTNTHVTNIKVL